jgi:hemoglobin-like flavoprotein
MQKLSDTEIYILECGLGWIKEAPNAFWEKLFHRLMRDHPDISADLHTTDIESFRSQLVQALTAIIEDLRSWGRIQSPILEHGVDLLTTIAHSLNSRQLSEIAETFLDVFSELAEDAWSPAMKTAWRKAIYEVTADLGEQQPETFSFLKMASPFHFRRDNYMNQPFVFFLGALAILAGSLASLSLWSRCRLAEVKLHRKPSLKKVWCG